jgi:hypothetical protein
MKQKRIEVARQRMARDGGEGIAKAQAGRVQKTVQMDRERQAEIDACDTTTGEGRERKKQLEAHFRELLQIRKRRARRNAKAREAGLQGSPSSSLANALEGLPEDDFDEMDFIDWSGGYQ